MTLQFTTNASASFLQSKRVFILLRLMAVFLILISAEHINAVGHSDADLELHVTADDGALEFSDVEAVQQNNDGNDCALCDICGKCEPGCSCNSAQMITKSPTPTNMELLVTDDGTSEDFRTI